MTSPQRDTNEDELTPEQIAGLRERLIRERRNLLERVAAHQESAVHPEDRPADEMDEASLNQDLAFQLRLADDERNLVVEIDAALARMDAGTYGMCEGTDEPIGIRRLEARPWTRYSVAYQESLEHEQRARGAR